MLEQLKILYNSLPKRSFAIILKKKHPELYSWVIESTDETFATFNERVFWLLNPIDLICKNGNRKKYVAKDQRFGFCDRAGKCECNTESLNKTGVESSIFGTKEFLDKRAITWKNNYGTDNPMKIKSVSEKVSKALIGREVDSEKLNNYQLTGYNDVIERLKDVMTPLFTFEEYNGSFRLNEYKWQCVQCTRVIDSHIDYGTVPRCNTCNPKTVSSGEKELKEFITSLNITFEENTKKIIHPLELDIYIPNKNLAIEYNGIYWHSDKKRGKTYHVDKYLLCKEKGIHLIQIFEDEWTTKKDIIKSRLTNILNCSNKIYARNCQIKEVTGKIAKEFIDNNHLQGWVSSSINLGLYYKDELVSLMTFGNARYGNKESFELLRYCSTGTIVGGPSKLFSYFSKTYKPVTVLSYADRCWSNGELYKVLNFKDVTEDDRNIGYFYVKGIDRFHRSTLTKKRLVEMGYDKTLTADEILDKNGFIKIFNCGNYKFVYTS